MKSHRTCGGWFGRLRRACITAGLVVVGLGSTAVAETLRYVLLQDSTYTAGGRAPLVSLKGSFRLVSQVSPLDRQFYRVDTVRLETAGGQVWRGSGRYSLATGGRGAQTQQWVLELTDGVSDVRFDSGAVPLDGRFPDLDLKLTGDASSTPMIHVVAVPEYSRQHHRTVLGTRLLDDCAVCDRVPLPVPLDGGFDLVRTGGNPLFDRYHVLDLRLSDGANPPGTEVTGEGTLEVGGEVAVQHRWTLRLQVRTPRDTRVVTLVNEDLRPGRLWPMLQAELAEVGGTPLSRHFLSLATAPFREIWFGTRNGMTPGAVSTTEGRITGADVLADAGRVVVRGTRLQAATGLSSGVGVDAFDVVPGGSGVVAFSPDQASKSTTLGWVSEGDVLGSDGRVRHRNPDLLGALGFMPPTPDLGLDAFVQRAPGEFWFSTREAGFSERLGVKIGRGDLLSSRGTVVRTQAQLLARFQPPDRKHDHGLDAFFAWPSGEAWFSVEEGFQDAVLGPVMEGDLLSDQGYVVARNLGLVRAFQPLEDLADFGLRSLWVVSDAAAGAEGVVLGLPQASAGGLAWTWKGDGRVYQVESTARLDDPFRPVTPLFPGVLWTGLPGGGDGFGFLRVRGW